jgi:hypothetical protein
MKATRGLWQYRQNTSRAASITTTRKTCGLQRYVDTQQQSTCSSSSENSDCRSTAMTKIIWLGSSLTTLSKKRTLQSSVHPLTVSSLPKYSNRLKKSDNSNSDHSLFANIVTLARYIGPWVSKYAWITQSRVDYHTYSSGCHVIKAFTTKDVAFFDKSWCRLSTVDDSLFEVANTIRITWRIQKNCQNGQTITLSSGSAHPDLCPVRSTPRLVLRARQLKQPDTMLLGCYRTKKFPLVYLTVSRISALIQEAVKKVRLGISAEDHSKYSAHSIWVWACVFLDEAGKSPDYIWKQLCWIGDSFWMYLHDRRIIQDAHCKALRASNRNILTLLHAQPADVMQNMLMSEGTADANVGEYYNKMDWSILIFMTNDSLHKIIILVTFYQSIRPAMSRAQNAITLPHCQKTETNPNYPFNYHFLPHLQPGQHLLHSGPTLVQRILLRPSWSSILDPPKGPPQDH